MPMYGLTSYFLEEIVSTGHCLSYSLGLQYTRLSYCICSGAAEAGRSFDENSSEVQGPLHTSSVSTHQFFEIFSYICRCSCGCCFSLKQRQVIAAIILGIDLAVDLNRCSGFVLFLQCANVACINEMPFLNFH